MLEILWLFVLSTLNCLCVHIAVRNVVYVYEDLISGDFTMAIVSLIVACAASCVVLWIVFSITGDCYVVCHG